MDGPGTPFDRRKLRSAYSGSDSPATIQQEEAPPPDGALIIVKLPAEATLQLDGTKTKQTGSYRRFLASALPAGRIACYTIQAHWIVGDVELQRTEKVLVEPGQTVTVNFLSTDSWTGKRRLATEAQRRMIANISFFSASLWLVTAL
jgi:uncharacterized protein (TIGR03000 family)